MILHVVFCVVFGLFLFELSIASPNPHESINSFISTSSTLSRSDFVQPRSIYTEIDRALSIVIGSRSYIYGEPCPPKSTSFTTWSSYILHSTAHCRLRPASSLSSRRALKYAGLDIMTVSRKRLRFHIIQTVTCINSRFLRADLKMPFRILQHHLAPLPAPEIDAWRACEKRFADFLYRLSLRDLVVNQVAINIVA